MQRVLSLFPAGRAGMGLLCLRATVACGSALVSFEAARKICPLLLPCGSLMTLLLLAGLMTRTVAGLCCAIGVLLVLWAGQLPSLCDGLAFLAAASLMMGGPGAYSVDALLFGRRRVNVGVARGDSDA